MVDRYLEKGTMYVLDDYGVKAECAVTDEGSGILEIKNIAVMPGQQKAGYGKRIDKHFYADQDITNDEKINLTLKVIGGMYVSELTEDQKEIAAKAIECGFLRKSGDILEQQTVTVEFKEWEKYRNLLRGYYDSVEDVCNGIAVELHDYMVTHI